MDATVKAEQLERSILHARRAALLSAAFCLTTTFVTSPYFLGSYAWDPRFLACELALTVSSFILMFVTMHRTTRRHVEAITLVGFVPHFFVAYTYVKLVPVSVLHVIYTGQFLIVICIYVFLSFRPRTLITLGAIASTAFLFGVLELAAQGNQPFYLETTLIYFLTANFLGFYSARLRERHFAVEYAQRRKIRESQEKRLSVVTRTTQMLVHDLRRPFGMIRAFGQALKQSIEPAKVAELASAFREQLAGAEAAIDELTSDLLQFDKDLALNLEEGEPADAVRRAFAALGRLASEPSGQFVVEYRHDHQALMSRKHFVRVLVNLLDNALDANQGLGLIWLKTRSVAEGSRSFVELRVGNSESFIAPEERELLFEAFYTRGKSAGTGLGLAICQKIATAHHGVIRVESDSRKGTEFVFLVPAGKAKAEDKVPPRLPSQAAGATNAANAKNAKESPAVVIVIDDDPFMRDVWRGSLSAVSLRTFDSPSAFLAACAAEPLFLEAVECIVTDFFFQRHEMNGFELAKKIRAMTTAPIVLCSQHQPDATERLAFDHFLSQPVDSWRSLAMRLPKKNRRHQA